MAAHAYDLAGSAPCRKPASAETKQNKPNPFRIPRALRYEILNALLRHDPAEGQADEVLARRFRISPDMIDAMQVLWLQVKHGQNVRYVNGNKNALSLANAYEHEVFEEGAA